MLKYRGVNFDRLTTQELGTDHAYHEDCRFICSQAMELEQGYCSARYAGHASQSCMPGCDSNNGFHGETSEMSSFASY